MPGAVGQCFVTIYNGEVLSLAASDLNESLIRFVQDGGEGDFDVFDATMRIANESGKQISFTVYQLARKSLIEGRKASKLLKDMMQTKMRKMRRLSNPRHKRQRPSSR